MTQTRTKTQTYCTKEWACMQGRQLPQRPSSRILEAIMGDTSAPEALSERQLTFAAWWVAHKPLLRKVGHGTLIALNVFFWTYSAWGWGAYILFGVQADRELAREIVRSRANIAELHERLRPKDIFVGETTLLPAGAKFDIVALVQNPNDRHVARVRYHFTAGGAALPEDEATVLPGQEKALAALGISERGDPTLTIDQVEFTRISAHAIADPLAYIAERMNFALADQKFYPPGTVPGVPVAIATFTLENASSYSFWRTPLYVLFRYGERLGGVEYLVLDQFRAGEKRLIDLRPKGVTGQPTAIEVLPDINVFDERVYMPPR